MNVYPAQYEDITGKNIEITFSKPMDIGTFNTGLHIYPEIFSKSYRWENNTLIIEIQEMLIPNSNYFFPFLRILSAITITRCRSNMIWYGQVAN